MFNRKSSSSSSENQKPSTSLTKGASSTSSTTTSEEKQLKPGTKIYKPTVNISNFNSEIHIPSNMKQDELESISNSVHECLKNINFGAEQSKFDLKIAEKLAFKYEESIKPHHHQAGFTTQKSFIVHNEEIARHHPSSSLDRNSIFANLAKHNSSPAVKIVFEESKPNSLPSFKQ